MFRSGLLFEDELFPEKRSQDARSCSGQQEANP